MSLAHAIKLPLSPPGRVPNAAARAPHLQVIPGFLGQDTGLRAAELYREYGPAVYRRCRRMLRDEEQAADATQEVFLRLVRHGAALADRADLLPWLYRVATNFCLNQLRNARGHAEEGLEEGLEAGEGPSHPAADGQLARQILSHFDEVTQVIAVGIVVEGRDAEEVARELGVSRRTVSRKLDRFLARARLLLCEGAPA